MRLLGCVNKTCTNCDNCCCSSRLVAPTKETLERVKGHNDMQHWIKPVNISASARTISITQPFKGVTRVTRMAYSSSLWLMANWLVKQIQPVSKIETKSDTNLRSLYESWFRNALISKSEILWWQVKKGINSELEGANTRRVLNILSKMSLYLMRSSHTSAHLQKKSTCFSSWTSPHSHLSQMLEPPCHLQDSTLK